MNGFIPKIRRKADKNRRTAKQKQKDSKIKTEGSKNGKCM